MGVTFQFDEAVADGRLGTVKAGNGRMPCSVEVADNHGTPEIRIGPEGEAHKGWTAKFNDWEQFTRFADAVEALHFRLNEWKTSELRKARNRP